MKLARTNVISLANQKGGCGKSTTTVSLAAALAAEGFSVTVVDTDPQCNATDAFGIDREQLAKEGRFTLADAFMAKKPARDVEIDFGERFEGRLTVIAGHKGLGTVSQRLEAQLQAGIANGQYSDLDADDVKNEHRHRLRQSLESLQGIRDLVLIDTPPDLGFLMTSSLIASDWCIIPVFPSGHDLKGLETLVRNFQKVKQRYNQELEILGVLLGNIDPRAKLDQDILNMLVEMFGEEYVFQTAIGRSVKHREATVHGLTIIEHAPGQPPADQFRSLAKEVIARLRLAEKQEASYADEPLDEALEVNRG